MRKFLGFAACTLLVCGIASQFVDFSLLLQQIADSFVQKMNELLLAVMGL